MQPQRSVGGRGAMERLLFFSRLLLLALAGARRLRAAETGSFLCNLGSFQCTDGAQVPMCSRCDGRPDCGDGSDEHGCRNGHISCGRRGRQCGSEGPCLPWERFCDGHRDCPGGSDEEADACGHLTALSAACQEDYFRCAPGAPCFTLAWVCDGHPDCLDERDEWGCSSDSPPETSRTPEANCTESTVTPEINYRNETAIAEILLLPVVAATALVVVVLIVVTIRTKGKPLLANFLLDKGAERLMLKVQP